MPRAFLTPTSGLGSGSRTGPAILISSPRNNIASQGRIYAFEKARGQGQQYISFLLQSLGPQRTPYANGKYGSSLQFKLGGLSPPPVDLLTDGGPIDLSTGGGPRAGSGSLGSGSLGSVPPGDK